MKRDKKYFDRYSLIVGLLAVVAVALIVLSTRLSGLGRDGVSEDSEEYQASVAERIRPLGRIYLPGEELSAGEPQVPAAETPEPVATSLSGPQVYNQACNVCHGAGIGGAPLLTDAADWQARAAQGTDALNDHAVNGYTGAVGFMPPKGGNTALSDAEVHAAVEFMRAEAAGQ